MTHAADIYAALAQREPGMPGMAVMFDAPRLAHVLAGCSGATIDSIKPAYLRYKRRTNCLVAYDVTGSMGASVIYAKAFRSGGGDELTTCWNADAAATWLGPGPLVLPELGLSVWAHPNDAKLKQLRLVADAEGRATLTRRASCHLAGASNAFKTLSYKPERRFVAALSGDNGRSTAALIKMYASAGYDHARLRARCVSSREILSVPSLLARDSRRHLLFFEWLPGRCVAELVTSKEPLNGRLEMVGRALAELHNQPLTPATPVSPSFDLRAMRRVISDVKLLLPALSGRLALLDSRLDLFDGAIRSPLGPTHGDFHLRQVLVSPSSVSIVDFDRSGAGADVGDLAFCVANLERDVLSGRISRDRMSDAVEELLSGYGRVRKRPSSRVLDVYIAAALASLLPEPLRLFFPHASDVTERMLDRALSLLMPAERRSAVS